MQTNATVEQLKNNFQLTLSKFSHEIRNPVTLIRSGLQMLASSHPEITYYEGWDDILDNVEYVIELLNELSNYNNAGTVTLTATNLRDYLEEVLSSIKPTLDYMEIALESQLPEILPTLPIDRIKLRQALINLLRNAQESIPQAGGKITVRAEQSDTALHLSISDNGCGINPDLQKNIFTPFVTSKPSGTGLGLAVTKEIIEAHGGKLEFQSTPGQGSTFYVLLG